MKHFFCVSLPLASCQWGDNWLLQATYAGLGSPTVSAAFADDSDLIRGLLVDTQKNNAIATIPSGDFFLDGLKPIQQPRNFNLAVTSS